VSGLAGLGGLGRVLGVSMIILDKFLPALKVDIQNDDTNMPPQYQLVLEQQYFGLSQLYQANDHLDDKALSLLQAAGLILALVGALEIPGFVATSEPALWAKVGISLGFAAFVAMVVTVALAWRPGASHLPGTQDWNKVYDKYVTVELNHSFDKVLVDAMEVYDRIAAINIVKAKRLRWAVWLFLLQIIGLLILAMASWLPIPS
jgi:hypothetical protein